MNRFIQTIVLCCVVALLLAGSYIGSKYLQAHMHPFAFTAARIGLATLILLPFVGLSECRFLTIRRSVMLLGVGFFGFFLVNHLFTIALHYAPSTNVSIVNSTLPIMMLLASCILARRYPSLYEVIACVCAFVGVLLILSKNNLASISLQKGEMIMLVSNCAGVANNMLVQKLGQYFSSLFLTGVGSLIGMSFLLPLGFSDHVIQDLAGLGPFEWMVLVAVAVLCTALPFWGYTQAIITIGAETATFLVMGLGPLFVALLSYFFLGEPITTLQMFGATLVVLALYFNLRSNLGQYVNMGG